MFGKVSSDQHRVGLNGSGALSHVYIQHPPLRCSIPETQGLFYDDGNKILISPTSDQVLSWKTTPFAQVDPPSSDSVGEGPTLAIRYSLDGKVIGIQRSNHEIQFKNRETGETFSRRCRPESESILGFFWTDCPTCDIVFIKTSGLDFLSYEPDLNTLRLVEAKRFTVSWYVYTHESRMVLLASGMQCKIFSAYQFSSGGIICLPKFEMTIAKAEANMKPVLAAEDVHIVTIYGRIYCLQVDRIGMLLYLYRFYRDAVVQQGSLPIYSSRIAFSVVDNVLLVHQVDAKVIILYDIFLDSLAPISAPLPLLLRGTSTNSRQKVHVEDNSTSAYGGMIYGDSWTFLVPDLICDVDNGMLWRIHLDLEAIAASSSDIPSVLEFLQRRRSDPSLIKLLCLEIMRNIILERRPISMIAQAIDVLVASYSYSIKIGNAVQRGDRRASSEKAQHSGCQRMDSSGIVSEEPMSGMEILEKSIRQESMREVENEPQQSIVRDVENEALDHSATSSMNRTSACLVSDSEGNADPEALRTNSGVSLEKSLSGDILASARDEKRKGIQAENSEADFKQSPLHSEAFEPSNTPPDSSVSSQQAQFANGAISPDEMYQFVFALVEEEMGGDPAYLVAVIVEFFRSVSLAKFKVHPNLYVMTIQLLARTNRFAELGLFVINKILEPSKEVAVQLLESGRQNFQTRKLGIDMLRQLSLHHDYVNKLLQDGYYLEALRYARKNKVTSVRPSLFLEAASATNDSQHLAAVLRFFSDFTPGFKNTTEHSRYHRILVEMS